MYAWRSVSRRACRLQPSDFESQVIECTSLEVLHLGGNRISYLGAMAIAESLKFNTSLEELNLANCGVEASATLPMAQALLANRHLKGYPG